MSEHSRQVRRRKRPVVKLEDAEKSPEVIDAPPELIGEPNYFVSLDEFLQNMARIATGGMVAGNFQGAIEIVRRAVRNDGEEITPQEASKLIQSKIQRSPHVVKG